MTPPTSWHYQLMHSEYKEPSTHCTLLINQLFIYLFIYLLLLPAGSGLIALGFSLSFGTKGPSLLSIISLNWLCGRGTLLRHILTTLLPSPS